MSIASLSFFGWQYFNSGFYISFVQSENEVWNFQGLFVAKSGRREEPRRQKVHRRGPAALRDRRKAGEGQNRKKSREVGQKPFSRQFISP
jgi:hypothetical protein